ncbi:MFS transporter [Streptomyces coeruleorubidus]|uniref:MFS transporter n=1 Tax=Streptomyces coeruleorubidus TaxID=116188 RepID=UPI00237F7895|nr:MFS transporter [Streptomyces coeruleorubidus]WDV54275.1 MFS transporter [Streptomyces coeruleorubidus]
MNTAASDRSGVDKPRFRETLRGLPRRVWIISLGSLILQVGNFLPVFIVLYLTQRGHSAGAAGLVLGASGLGSVLGHVIGGYLTDTIGRRSAILLSVVTTSGLTALVPFVEPLPVIVIVVGLIGVMSQIHRPAMAAVLVDSVAPEQRLAAFGVLRFAQNIGAALGGVLGGILASHSYVELFLLEAAALLLFGVIVAVLLRDGTRPRSDEDEADPQEDRTVGYRQALTDRTLVRFLLMTVFGMFVYIQTTVGLPLHVNDTGLDEQDFGLLMGLNGLLVVLLELPLISLVSRYRPEYVLAAGNLFTCVGLTLTGFATNMGMLAVTVMIWTFGEMVYSSIVQAHLVNLTPPGMVGRYQGLYGAAYTAGTGAGPVIGGAVYAYAPWVLWTMTGVLGLLSVQLSLRLRPSALAAKEASPSAKEASSSAKEASPSTKEASSSAEEATS